MNPLTKTELEMFDEFVESLPKRVGETPHDVLKDWFIAHDLRILAKAKEMTMVERRGSIYNWEDCRSEILAKWDTLLGISN